MITQGRLKELVRYEPNDGQFTRVSNGAIAGSIFKIGYVYLTLDDRKYLAHRLAWLYVTGEWPNALLDHINGSRVDNRFANLRLASYLGNSGNRGPNKNNKSGYKGVFRSGRTWTAQISLYGKHTHLGCWPSQIEAASAYDLAAVKHFGEFAKTNRSMGLLA